MPTTSLFSQPGANPSPVFGSHTLGDILLCLSLGPKSILTLPSTSLKPLKHWGTVDNTLVTALSSRVEGSGSQTPPVYSAQKPPVPRIPWLQSVGTSVQDPRC